MEHKINACNKAFRRNFDLDKSTLEISVDKYCACCMAKYGTLELSLRNITRTRSAMKKGSIW